MMENTNGNNLAYLDIDSVYLDPNNYRLVNSPLYVPVEGEFQYTDSVVQKRTMRMICGEKDEEIADLMISFKENGYLYVDYIQVRLIKDNHFVVIEGNRRVAALKKLKEQFENFGSDLKNLEYAFFKSIPVRIVSVNKDSTKSFILMALKHINGNKKWGEWNQAIFLADLKYKQKIEEDDICNKIGITKNVLRPTLRAYSLVEQYKSSDYGDQYKENKFPMFKEIVRNANLKEWLNWNDNDFKAESPKNLDILFNLISKIDSDNHQDGDDVENSLKKEPALIKREDIRKLSEFIKDDSALNLLLETRNLDAAYNRSIAVADLKLENVVNDLISATQSVLRLRLNEEAVKKVNMVFEDLSDLLDKTELELNSNIVNEVRVIKERIKLSQVKFNNFKCLNKTELDNCSLVNIIAGNNNSGKTSLLEAIYLLLKQNDINSVLKLVRMRGKKNDKYKDYKWVSKQLFSFNIIGITCDNDNIQTQLEILDSVNYGFNNKDEYEDYLVTGNYLATLNEVTKNMNFRIGKNTLYTDKGQRCQPFGLVDYSSPFFYGGDRNKYKDYYSKAMENKLVTKILGFIKENIVSTINNIYWDEPSNRFMVDDSNFDKTIDISKYGEGLQRIFHVALMFANNRNGVILIDEFENAIHTTLLKPFAKFVCELAKTFKVQLFLTSHSKECIDSFAGLDVERSFYGLKRNESNTEIIYLNSEYFEEMLDFMNLDLRMAR